MMARAPHGTETWALALHDLFELERLPGGDQLADEVVGGRLGNDAQPALNPCKSGFDVAHYLRHQCGMPFMFLSAFSDEQTVAQVKALGAVAYLVKPLDIKQIVPAVEAEIRDVIARRRRPAAR